MPALETLYSDVKVNDLKNVQQSTPQATDISHESFWKHNWALD